MGIATRGAGTANRTASWEIKPELLDTNNDGIQDFSYKVSLVQSLTAGRDDPATTCTTAKRQKGTISVIPTAR